jgi:hypothetical protein
MYSPHFTSVPSPGITPKANDFYTRWSDDFLDVDSLEIDSLEVDSLEVDSLEVDSLEVDSLEVDDFHSPPLLGPEWHFILRPL